MNDTEKLLREELEWKTKQISSSIKHFDQFFANQPDGPKDPSGIPMSVPYEIYWAWRSLMS